jgi:probable rRNA maturation factor
MSKIEVTNLTKNKIDKKYLSTVADKVLKIVKLRNKEVSVVLVGENKIKELNKRYRKKNKVTDVLAFDYGEIFICIPQAKKQAKKAGHSFKKELAFLLIHGILHLAGYHDDKVKQKEVWQKITI